MALSAVVEFTWWCLIKGWTLWSWRSFPTFTILWLNVYSFQFFCTFCLPEPFWAQDREGGKNQFSLGAAGVTVWQSSREKTQAREVWHWLCGWLWLDLLLIQCLIIASVRQSGLKGYIWAGRTRSVYTLWPCRMHSYKTIKHLWSYFRILSPYVTVPPVIPTWFSSWVSYCPSKTVAKWGRGEVKKSIFSHSQTRPSCSAVRLVLHLESWHMYKAMILS